tara:strand:+ start:1292 stop:1474 length:183 start_codon:yes stop_codon:yes gene_type:complete
MKNATYILSVEFSDDPHNEVEEEFTSRNKAIKRYDEVSWENDAELHEFSGSFHDVIRSTH